MRVLLFTLTACNYKQTDKYNGGGWQSSIESLLSMQDDIDLGIAFFLDGQPSKVIGKNHVIYYPMKSPKESTWNKFKELCLECLNTKLYLESYKRKYKRYQDILKKPVDDFKPDVILVFGSESPLGLVSYVTDVPVILHVQGIIAPYLNAYLPPFISWKHYLGNPIRFRRYYYRRHSQLYWKSLLESEKCIYSNIKYIFGRTEWDKRISLIMNPRAEYYIANEVLRPIFYEKKKRVIPKELTIVTTISSPLYKGFDVVLKTAKILCEQNIKFKWYCYGNIDPTITEKTVAIKHEFVNVELYGVASSEELANALCSATVYVHPSYIDNSPNSICEAQMLGCTTIATYVGGIPSLIRHKETGFLVPSNDPFLFASYISELFYNADLNSYIGNMAQLAAKERHNKENIASKLLQDFSFIIERHKKINE